MTYKEQYNDHTTWQEKVVIMNLFHCLQVATKKRWRMADTASYFDVSLSLVSENLKLAEHLDVCKHIEFRDKAIQFVRNL